MPRTPRRMFVAGMSGLAIAAALPARAATLVPVRVGSVPAEAYFLPYYGNSAGIFQNAGIDVQITSLANSGAIVAAMLGGSLDVGMGSPTGIAQARLRGVPLKIFAPGGMYSSDLPPTALAMVANNSPLKKPSDLVGKTIATDLLKSLQQAAMILWLQKNGVDPSSVRWLEFPFASMAAGLERGQIDVALIAEPALSVAKTTCRTFCDYNSAIAPRYFISTWFSTEAWLGANPQLAHTLARAAESTAVWASQHPSDALAVIEQYSKMSRDTIEHMTHTPYGTKLDPAMVEAPIQAAYKTGVSTSMMSANELIAAGFSQT